jgi:hypothetical protein
MTDSPLHPSRLLELLTGPSGRAEKAGESLIEQLLARDAAEHGAVAGKAPNAQAAAAVPTGLGTPGSLPVDGTIPTAGEKIPGAGQ